MLSKFKVKNGLFVENNGIEVSGSSIISGSTTISGSFSTRGNASIVGSGSNVFTVDGFYGRLFSAEDTLTGSIYSINTIGGLPIVEVYHDSTIRMGQFGRAGLFITRSLVGIGTETPTSNLDVSGSSKVSGTFIVSGSSITTQSLSVVNGGVRFGSTTGFNWDASNNNVGMGTPSSANYRMDIDGTGASVGALRVVGGSSLFQDGKMTIAPSTASYASLNIPSGSAPTSSVNGDLWNDGTNLGINIGGRTSYLANGSGAAGQVTYWSGTSAVTGSATLTYTPTTALLVNNSITASSAIARGVNFTPTLTAAANNDVLVGLDVNPTFTNGAFTGVVNILVRIGASSNTPFGSPLLFMGRDQNTETNFQISNATSGTSATVGFRIFGANGRSSQLFEFSALHSNTEFASHLVLEPNAPSFKHGFILSIPEATLGSDFMIYTAGRASTNRRFTLFNGTGNLLLQSGGTHSDAGYRLDVNGTGATAGALRVTGGNVVITGSVTSSPALTLTNGGFRIGSTTGFNYDASNSNLGIGVAPSAAYRVDIDGAGASTGALRVTGVGSTFDHNITINGLSIGRGANNISSNLQFGAATLSAITTGTFNNAFGESALRNTTSGARNTAIGVNSLRYLTTGNDNISFGYNALSDIAFNGSSNTALGNTSLTSATTATNNVAIGYFALRSNTTGNDNVAIGKNAGYNVGTDANTTGNNNIFIGTNAIGTSVSESNKTWIGNSSTTQTWLGGNLALGQTSATALADLAGSTTSRASLRIRSGSAPTTPNEGDIWHMSGSLYMHSGTTKKILTTDERPYGVFSSSAIQTASLANTDYVITFDTTEESNGVSVVSGSRMVVSSSGVYNLQFSAQLDNTSSGTQDVTIWLRKGVGNAASTDVVRTSTDVTLVGNNAKQVAAWNLMLSMNANDYLELVWCTTTTNIRLYASGTRTGPIRPALPSVIATMNKVS